MGGFLGPLLAEAWEQRGWGPFGVRAGAGPGLRPETGNRQWGPERREGARGSWGFQQRPSWGAHAPAA